MAKLLIFNWKMNPATLNEALVLAQESDHENVVVVPPFLFLESVGGALSRAQLGAQDAFWENPPVGGAFTGEVSANELKDLCVKYVIVGHSERRHKLGETDEIIAKKMKVVMDAGLIPILCVGETKAEKDADQKEEVIKRQLKIGLSLYPKPYTLNPLIVAYEPVWAIGNSNPETPEHAAETIRYIKSILKLSAPTLSVGVPTPLGVEIVRPDAFGRGPDPFGRRDCSLLVLYGGSVDSKNLKDFLRLPEIDGALVGGASLKKEEIEKMIAMV